MAQLNLRVTRKQAVVPVRQVLEEGSAMNVLTGLMASPIVNVRYKKTSVKMLMNVESLHRSQCT